MKTSILIIVLIFLNTTAIIAEPVYQLLNGVSTWLLLLAELILILSYFVNSIIKDIKRISEINLNGLLTQNDIDNYINENF